MLSPMDYISQYLSSLYSGVPQQTNVDTMRNQTGFQNPLAQQAMERAQPNLLEQARQMYPRLKNVDVGYKESIGARPDAYLEYWPVGETGGSYKRPSELSMDKPGIEVYKPETQAKDIAGDIFSHQLMWNDPQVAKIRQEFEKSITPDQKDFMKKQWREDMIERKKFDPKSKTLTFDEWYKQSGLPSYIRGYTFDQWSPEEIKDAYTPKQLQILDRIKGYLKTE